MSKIGHASIDERGKAAGGAAGDQNKKEVCIRDYYVYKGGWSIVLRPVSAKIAEASAAACEAGCKNDKIGYDQNQRNTLHTKARAIGYELGKIKEACETDCSAFMTVCAIAGGVKELEYTGNAPTTSTMEKAFVASGKYKALKEKKYLGSDSYLKRGDILVAPGHHTVMVLENGDKTKDKSENGVGYYPKYRGTSYSIVEALNSIGAASTINARKKIAERNGIKGYSGKAEENMRLLALLKSGKLMKV